MMDHLYIVFISMQTVYTYTSWLVIYCFTVLRPSQKVFTYIETYHHYR
jgi:uncharacterized protein YggT (Ycf19 family)